MAGEWRSTLAASGTVTSEIPPMITKKGPIRVLAAWTAPTAARVAKKASP